MEILGIYGKDELAKVYIADMRGDIKHLVEFVESTQPPIPQKEKWVFIVSVQYGCPVDCQICDAGGNYYGKLRTQEILDQIDYLIRQKYPDGNVPVPKFKIQFARMGEPALNMNVLEVLEIIPKKYKAPGFIPAVSSIAPKGTDEFFEKLIQTKEKYYTQGRFQLQFSIHTTDKQKRDEIMPIEKWSFNEISEYGKRFVKEDDRKIALNFAALQDYPIDAEVIGEHFDPDLFLIKLTPLNPTKRIKENHLFSLIDPYDENSSRGIVEDFQSQGFDVILSIGELEENQIGSNCGMFVSQVKNSTFWLNEAYETEIYRIQ